MARDPDQLRRDALAIWRVGVETVCSDRLVRQVLRVEETALVVGDQRLDLDAIGRIVVVGAGKAGAGMAAGVEEALGPRLLDEKHVAGWVNVPEDCVRPLTRIHLHAARPAGVNEPTKAGVVGAEEILRLVGSLAADDLCLCLISGGGSALMPAPVEGITLEDKLAVTQHLSASGANIEQLNTVRKQLSRIKGGGLARACRAGRLVALIISDVLGDPLDVIASGPTVEDSSTPSDALAVLERFGGRAGDISDRVFAYLRQSEKAGEPAASGESVLSGEPAASGEPEASGESVLSGEPAASGEPEASASGCLNPGCLDPRAHARGSPELTPVHSPRPPGPRCQVTNLIIGNNATAVDAAGRAAERLGYSPTLFSANRSEGPAEAVGCDLAEQALRMRTQAGPDCLISGGEPVVKLVDARHRGLGGRNQQLALAALQRLWDDGAAGLALLSGGTDGEDGPTDAAGAIVDASVVAAARRLGLSPAAYLASNDAYHFFDPLDALLRTGPTHTNVCDLRVVVVDRVERSGV